MGKRIAALACLALAATGGAAWAAYSGTTSNPTSTITAKRIYPAERSWSAFKVADASGGAAETDASAPLGYAGDGLIYTTGNWSSAFSSTRYVDFDYNAPLAAGLPVANAKLNVRVLGNANGPRRAIWAPRFRSADRRTSIRPITAWPGRKAGTR
jgi:hypothetical protein